MLTRLLPLMVVCFSLRVAAQPATEIFLYDLKIRKGGVSLEKGENVTNHPGYDNQPFFHPEAPLLYYVSADPDGRTDIYEYQLESGKTTHVTSTREREYSPTVMPGARYLSCIIQRDNGEQDLARYPIRGGEPDVLVDNLMVGYHAWADASHVALFVLPQPFYLHLVNVENRTDTLIASGIGRSLQRIPRAQAVSFLQEEDGVWYVRRFDLKTREVSTLTQSLNGQDHDMCWTPRGGIIMSHDHQLFYWHPRRPEWVAVASIEPAPKGTISRVAVDPAGKTIALVFDEE